MWWLDNDSSDYKNHNCPLQNPHTLFCLYAEKQRNVKGKHTAYYMLNFVESNVLIFHTCINASQQILLLPFMLWGSMIYCN
jgi:hypothetical protein